MGRKNTQCCLFASALLMLTACGHVAKLAGSNQIPGSLAKEFSLVDGSGYIKAQPGRMPLIGKKALGLLGGDSSELLIGAVRYNNGRTHLIALVYDILRIESLTINFDGKISSYRAASETEINLEHEGHLLTHSLNKFLVPEELVRAMVSEDTEKIYMKLFTSEGYIEGDFGASCESKFRDRSCIAIRNFLTAIDGCDSC